MHIVTRRDDDSISVACDDPQWSLESPYDFNASETENHANMAMFAMKYLGLKVPATGAVLSTREWIWIPEHPCNVRLGEQ